MKYQVIENTFDGGKVASEHSSKRAACKAARELVGCRRSSDAYAIPSWVGMRMADDVVYTAWSGTDDDECVVVICE